MARPHECSIMTPILITEALRHRPGDGPQAQFTVTVTPSRGHRPTAGDRPTARRRAVKPQAHCAGFRHGLSTDSDTQGDSDLATGSSRTQSDSESGWPGMPAGGPLTSRAATGKRVYAFTEEGIEKEQRQEARKLRT